MAKIEQFDSLTDEKESLDNKWYLTKSIATESDDCNEGKIRKFSRTPNDLRKVQIKHQNKLTDRIARSVETSTFSQPQDSNKDEEIQIIGTSVSFNT